MKDSKQNENKKKNEGKQKKQTQKETKQEDNKPKQQQQQSQKDKAKPKQDKHNTDVSDIKFFGLSTIDERLDEITKQMKMNTTKEDKTIFGNVSTNTISSKTKTSKEICELLSDGPIKYTSVCEKIITALVNISHRDLTKQATSCTELLEGLLTFVNSIKGDFYQLRNALKSLFEQITKIIPMITTECGAYDNLCSLLRNLNLTLAGIPYTPAPEEIKNTAIDYIEKYLATKIMTKDIIANKIPKDLIQNDECILVYGKSKIFRKMFAKAVEQGIRFSVILIDKRGSSNLKSEISFLSDLGISVRCAYITALSEEMARCTKVIIKAKSILSNGDVQGDLGNAIVGSVAHLQKKPLIVFCPTFKFWNMIKLSCYQNDNLSYVTKEDGYNMLDVKYDVTPGMYVNSVICEFGKVPADFVPNVIKQFLQTDF